jgi:hypothetical protein
MTMMTNVPGIFAAGDVRSQLTSELYRFGAEARYRKRHVHRRGAGRTYCALARLASQLLRRAHGFNERKVSVSISVHELLGAQSQRVCLLERDLRARPLRNRKSCSLLEKGSRHCDDSRRRRPARGHWPVRRKAVEERADPRVGALRFSRRRSPSCAW